MKRAFTLVELLVVISVISMLASIVMVQISLAQAKGRDSARTQQIRQIDLATQMYVETYKKAPVVANTLCDEISQSGVPDETTASACLAVSTASVDSDPDQYNNWQAFKAALRPFIEVPEDPCRGVCAPGNSSFPIGYTYVPPLAMQYYCAQPGHDCVATNESYQLYAPMERQTVPTGNNGSTDNYFSPSASYFTLTVNAAGVDIAVSGHGTCTNEDGSCEYVISEDTLITLTATSVVEGDIDWEPPCVGSGSTSGSTCQLVVDGDIITGASVLESPPFPPSGDNTPPSTPGGLSVTLDDQWTGGALGLHLTWDESTDDQSGIAGYKLGSEDNYGSYDEEGNWVPSAPQPGTSRDKSVQLWTVGSQICDSVRAFDNAENPSGPSATACSPSVPQPLLAPTNVSVTNQGGGQMLVTWDPSADNTSDADVRYQVVYPNYGGMLITETDQLSATFDSASWGNCVRIAPVGYLNFEGQDVLVYNEYRTAISATVCAQ